jgi:hypothetical protein
LLNVFGEILIEFYVSVTLAVFSPFNCYEHPNGKESVEFAPEIMCWEGEHNDLIILAFAGVLIYTVSTIAITFWAVMTYNDHMARNDVGFLIRCTFLFNRWRPEMYWFAAVAVSRNAAVAIWPMVISDQGVVAGLMFISLLLPLVLGSYVYPRRTPAMNALDTQISMTQMIILVLGAMAPLSSYGANYSPLAYVSVTSLAAVFIVCGFIIAMKGGQFISKGRTPLSWCFDIFYDHHGGSGATGARIIHVLFNDTFRPGKVFYDVDTWVRWRAMCVIADAARLSKQGFVALSNETWCRSYCTAALVALTQRHTPLAVGKILTSNSEDEISSAGSIAKCKSSKVRDFDDFVEMLALQAPRRYLRPLGLKDAWIPTCMKLCFTQKSHNFSMDDQDATGAFLEGFVLECPGLPLKPGVQKDMVNTRAARFFSEVDDIEAELANKQEEGSAALPVTTRYIMISCDHNDYEAVSASRLVYLLLRVITGSDASSSEGGNWNAGRYGDGLDAPVSKKEALETQGYAGFKKRLSIRRDGESSEGFGKRKSGVRTTKFEVEQHFIQDIDLTAATFSELIKSNRTDGTVFLITKGTWESASQLIRLGYVQEFSQSGFRPQPICIADTFEFPSLSRLDEIAQGVGMEAAENYVDELVSWARVKVALCEVLQTRVFTCHVAGSSVKEMKLDLINGLSRLKHEMLTAPVWPPEDVSQAELAAMASMASEVPLSAAGKQVKGAPLTAATKVAKEELKKQGGEFGRQPTLSDSGSRQVTPNKDPAAASAATQGNQGEEELVFYV